MRGAVMPTPRVPGPNPAEGLTLDSCYMSWHSALLPVPPSSILVGFTTDQNRLPTHPRIASVQIFEDSALGVHKTSYPDVLKHSTVARDGRLAWEALYPQGSVNPGGAIKGGFGLYLAGPKAFANALKEHAREVVIGYEVFFETGFQWAKGGKLPGVCAYTSYGVNYD